MNKLVCILIVLSIICLNSIGQTNFNNIPELDSLFENEEYRKSEKIIKPKISNFLHSKNADSLSIYLPYYTRALHKVYSKKETEDILNIIINQANEFNVPDMVDIYLLITDFYSSTDNHDLAYKKLSYALEKCTGTSYNSKKIAIYSNLGTYAMRQGKYELAAENYRRSLKLLSEEKTPGWRDVFIANNSMGIIMWYASIPDSCIYYFEKAIIALDKMEDDPVSSYYRKAIVENNIGNAYAEMGRIKESIIYLERAENNAEKFIALKENFPQKVQAQRLRFQAMDNLAKTEQETGNISKAKRLLEYSYRQKKLLFGENSPEVYKSLVALSGLYFQEGDFLKAYLTADNALEIIIKNGERGTAWEADAWFKKARAAEKTEFAPEAESYFTEAQKIYEEITGEEFSIDYLNFLAKHSLYYARLNNPAKALLISKKGIDYLIKHKSVNNLTYINQLKNHSEVLFYTGNNKKAIETANAGIKLAEQLLNNAGNRTDSVRIELEISALSFLKSQAEYRNLESRNPQGLMMILKEMEESAEIFEQTKTLYLDEKDITLSIESFSESSNLMISLLRDLYHITKEKKYLNRLVHIREKMISYRIQSQLNRKKQIEFAKIPQEIIKEEEKFKTLLFKPATDKTSSEDFFHNLQLFEEFQIRLSKEYPSYYQAKYGRLEEKSIEDYQNEIPEDITVIRYIYTNDKIGALIFDRRNYHWVDTDAAGLFKNIEELHKSPDGKYAPQLAHNIYKKLWQPLEKYIHTKRILIIPDGPLFYISFEMLPVKPVTNFRELVREAVIHKYTISYQYNLASLRPLKKDTKLKGYSAFVPGFSDREKSDYLKALKNDTNSADQNYLSLLPLPFSTGLANYIEDKENAFVYYGSNSTIEAFKHNSGKTAVIHIGTHAEANNIYPEYSRLIFSKDLNNPESDNSVYLHEIFNYDLNSRLAVLTACETGKPGYYPGEGMISMAYAFNYAGSESILTGLWKIDEQSSAIITQNFYEYLASGLQKDEALRLAKLKYLEKAEGRMISPGYWAGLVIIGDSSSVQGIQKSNNKGLIITGVLVLLSLLTFVGWKITRGRQ